ncbi:hypothetical protein HOD29_01325 [archaeon]|jgi:hypothetical protein|nr:hypothetical protein [archaeon]
MKNQRMKSGVNSFFSKNRKGAVSVVILVIGIFLVCSFALMTFFMSEFKVSNSFVGIELIKEVNLKIDEYNFYQNQGANMEKIKVHLNVSEEGGQDYFYLEKKINKFSFDFKEWKREVLLFSVRYDLE